MPERSTLNTDTTAWPAYASKADFMLHLEQAVNQEGGAQDKLYNVLYRLSNTNTSVWADPTARHDA